MSMARGMFFGGTCVEKSPDESSTPGASCLNSHPAVLHMYKSFVPNEGDPERWLEKSGTLSLTSHSLLPPCGGAALGAALGAVCLTFKKAWLDPK